ncbi:MAG: NADH-quinone oxidoreductase subunit C [Bacteroidia bacterium]|nr:NADH-quinone oxidoreductase subunit C [Bacteroidia bacterium]
MTDEQIKEKILKILPEVEIPEGKPTLTVIVPPDKLFTLAKELKESPDTSFDYLICLTGVDYGKSMSVFYHITSTKFNHTIILKTSTQNRETPAFDSVYSIWKTAEYHEREAYDLLGITFNNHPDLRRMFLDEDWVGHPLRKDYSDPINIVER